MNVARPHAPRSGAGPRGAVRGYARRFRKHADSALTEVEADPQEWLAFLLVSSVLAILLVAGIRLFQAWLVGRSALLGWIAVAPGTVLAAACIAVLIWVFWSIHRSPGHPRPYVVALFTVTTTIVVCTETFAGLTTVLSERGVLGAEGEAEPSLWAAEEHYLWSLANAVPLLDAPETVGWQDPQIFANRSSGILLLVFKLLVVFPLVQVVVAGYRLAEARWLAGGERKGPWLKLIRFSGAGQAWGLCILFLWLSVVALGVFVLLGESTSIADRWLSGHLVDGVRAFGVHVSLPWLQSALDIAAALFCLGLFWSILSEVGGEGLLRLRSLGALAGALCACLTLLAFGTVIAGGATLALLHADLAEARPAVSPGGELEAALEWHAWQLAEALPFFDIPSALAWSPGHEFAGRADGMVVLALRLVFFLVLLVPVAWLVRATVHRLRPPAAAQLGAFRDLVQELQAMQAQLDEIQAAILAERERREEWFREPVDLDAPFDTFRGITPPDQEVYPKIFRAQRRIGRLEPPLERVHALFGPGKASTAADVAVAAEVARLEVLDRHHWSPLSVNDLRRTFQPAQADAERAVAALADTATAALYDAAAAGGSALG